MAAALAVLGTPPAVAQQPALRVYSIPEGLPFSQVMCVMQDSRGFVWAGTSYGVSRYDGREFASLSKADGLPHDSVSDLAEDAEGTVWVRTQEGLARVAAMGGKAGEPLILPLPEPLRALAGPGILRMAAGGNALWLASATHLHRFRGGRLESWPLGTAVEGRLVALGPADAHSAWVTSQGRVARFHAEAPPRVLAPCPGLGPAVSLAARGSDLLLVQEGGLARLAGEGFVPAPEWGLPEKVEPRLLVPFGERAVVVTDSSGVFLLAVGVRPRHFGANEGLPSDLVNDAALDRDGVLWLATEDGLAKVFDFSVRSYASRRPALGPMVLAVAREPGGPLWAGHSEGLTRVGPDGALSRVELGPLGSSVWGLLPLDEAPPRRPEDSKGVLLATRRGLLHLRGGVVRRVEGLPPAASERTYGLARDREGRIWLSALRGLVRFRWDGRRGAVEAEPFDAVGGEPLGEARGIDVAPDGTVWVGTDGSGVVRWDGHGFRRLREGLTTGVCRTVLARPEGVWVGTDSGLFVIEGDRARPHDEVNRVLDDRYVVALRDAGDGSAWLATSYSVLRIREGRVEEAFDATRGLVGSSTTGENGLALDGDTLWVGMDRGLTGVGVGRGGSREREPAALILSAVDGAGRPVAWGSRLPHSANSVTFAFRSPTYVAEDRTRFQERLLGYEADWAPPHLAASQRYTNLPAGDYELQVRAVTPTGRAGPPQRLGFRVSPAWWQTAWARLLALTVLGLAVHAFARWRTRQLRLRAVELEQRVSDRTRALAESTRALEEAQKRISELLETADSAHEDVGAWAQATATAVARSLGVREIGVFSVEDGRATALGATAVEPPDAEELQRAFGGGEQAGGPRVVLGVHGPAGDALAALVVCTDAHQRTPTLVGEDRAPLLSAFAHQLGGALEMQRVRARLASAESARAAVVRGMDEQGVEALRVCPTCRRCFGGDRGDCPDDGAALGTPYLIPYRVKGRYRLSTILGSGGMGTVFLAEDERLGRAVALKVVHPDRVDDPSLRMRIEREAHAIARIQHEAVVALFDAGTLDDGSVFLVIERLLGHDLGEVLLRFGPGRPAQVASLVRQASAGLAAAHRAGVVHRDVKPQNLLLVDSPRGFRVKVVDFGLAKPLVGDGEATRTGVLLGTPAYMAPEQVAGRPVAAATDLYSLAAVGFEALTGRRLVGGASLGEMFSEILLGPAPRPSLHRPGLGPAVDEAFAAALHLDPARRPPSLEAWAESLAAALEGAEDGGAGWPEPLGAALPRGEAGSEGATSALAAPTAAGADAPTLGAARPPA